MISSGTISGHSVAYVFGIDTPSQHMACRGLYGLRSLKPAKTSDGIFKTSSSADLASCKSGTGERPTQHQERDGKKKMDMDRTHPPKTNQ